MRKFFIWLFFLSVFTLLKAERNCSSLEPSVIIPAERPVFGIVTFADNANKPTLVFLPFLLSAQLWQQTETKWEHIATLDPNSNWVPQALAQAVDSQNDKITVIVSGDTETSSGNGSFAVWQQQSDTSWQETSHYSYRDSNTPTIDFITAFTPPGGNFTLAGECYYGNHANITLFNQIDNQVSKEWVPTQFFDAFMPVLPIRTPDEEQFLVTFWGAGLNGPYKITFWKYTNGQWEINTLYPSNSLDVQTFAYGIADGIPILVVGDFNEPANIVLFEYKEGVWVFNQEFEAGATTMWALMTFQYNNQLFIVGGFGNQTIKIWKQVNDSWQVQAELCSREGYSSVHALGFLVDNQNNPLIASGHMDNKVRLWNVADILDMQHIFKVSS